MAVELKLLRDTHPNVPLAVSFGADEVQAALPVLLAALDAIQRSLPETSAEVEMRIAELREQFISLAGSATQQAQDIEEIVVLTQTVEIDGQRVTLKDAFSIFNETLERAVAKIVEISKLSVSMATQFDDAIHNLDAISGFIQTIHVITRQTRLLSINASIEAARAGKEGEGFAVVAEEVKKLSEQVAKLSAEMDNRVGQISKSVGKSYSTLQQVNAIDMTDNIMLQDHIHTIMEQIIGQNERINEVLNHAVTDTKASAQSITKSVMSLQFQDHVSQVLGSTCAVLKEISRTLEDAAPEHTTINGSLHAAIDTELLETITRAFLLSELKKKFATSLHARGCVDGIVAEDNHTSATNGHSNGTSDDDIELF